MVSNFFRAKVANSENFDTPCRGRGCRSKGPNYYKFYALSSFLFSSASCQRFGNFVLKNYHYREFATLSSKVVMVEDQQLYFVSSDGTSEESLCQKSSWQYEGQAVCLVSNGSTRVCIVKRVVLASFWQDFGLREDLLGFKPKSLIDCEQKSHRSLAYKYGFWHFSLVILQE